MPLSLGAGQYAFISLSFNSLSETFETSKFFKTRNPILYYPLSENPNFFDGYP
jgi:hypothetical protein